MFSKALTMSLYLIWIIIQLYSLGAAGRGLRRNSLGSGRNAEKRKCDLNTIGN